MSDTAKATDPNAPVSVKDQMFADLDRVKARSGEGAEFFLRMAYWNGRLDDERARMRAQAR